MLEPLFTRLRTLKRSLFTARDTDSHEPYRPTPRGAVDPKAEPAASPLGTDDETGRPTPSAGPVAEETRQGAPRDAAEEGRPGSAGPMAEGPDPDKETGGGSRGR